MLKFLSKAAFYLSGKETFLNSRDKQHTQNLCAVLWQYVRASRTSLSSCPVELAQAGQGMGLALPTG